MFPGVRHAVHQQTAETDSDRLWKTRFVYFDRPVLRLSKPAVSASTGHIEDCPQLARGVAARGGFFGREKAGCREPCSGFAAQ